MELNSFRFTKVELVDEYIARLKRLNAACAVDATQIRHREQDLVTTSALKTTSVTFATAEAQMVRVL